MESISKNNKSSNTKWIIFIILAALVGGLLGYFIGVEVTETELQKKYDAQVTQLQKDLTAAKAAAGESIDNGQAAVEEGQQTLESAQAENATLKATIEEQNKKIADLEKQLSEAQAANDTPTN